YTTLFRSGFRLEAERVWQSSRIGRNRGEIPEELGAMGRGQGRPEKEVGCKPLRGPAAASMYSARTRRGSGSAPDGRARIGPRSGLHLEDRGPYLRFEIAVHYCD